VDGHFGTSTHGQAEVGLGKRGGGVDSVPDHGHDLALLLQVFDVGVWGATSRSCL